VDFLFFFFFSLIKERKEKEKEKGEKEEHAPLSYIRMCYTYQNNPPNQTK
jgi:hypothetical protein